MRGSRISVWPSRQFPEQCWVPGEKFSFNKTGGETGIENRVSSRARHRTRTSVRPVVGGGICQVFFDFIQRGSFYPTLK